MTRIVIGPDGCTVGDEVDDAYVVCCCKCGRKIEPEYEDCECIDENAQVYICGECSVEEYKEATNDI